MPKSMTGYGQAQSKLKGRRFLVEVKSVNHKFCEVNVRMSSKYSLLEPRIIDLAKSIFSRGRIDIFIRDDSQMTSEVPSKVDIKNLKALQKELKRAAKSMGYEGEVNFSTLLHFPQFFLTPEEENLEQFWQYLKKLCVQAFQALEKMRQREGVSIKKSLLSQLSKIQKESKHIAKLVPKNIVDHRRQLEVRIKKLVIPGEVDPQRLAQEVAFFVDRTDITEELERLEDHLSHFKQLLDSAQPLGRKLDFLLQEINREINTMSAKVQNAKASQRVVECKHSIERMREQVQNME